MGTSKIKKFIINKPKGLHHNRKSTSCEEKQKKLIFFSKFLDYLIILLLFKYSCKTKTNPNKYNTACNTNNHTDTNNNPTDLYHTVNNPTANNLIPINNNPMDISNNPMDINSNPKATRMGTNLSPWVINNT